MKNIIKTLLLCIVIMLFMSENAQAEGKTVNIDGREWTYVVKNESDKTAEINKFLSNGYKTAILPSSVDGYTVISFTSDVFKKNSMLTSVEIPSTIKSIPNDAFKNDYSLSTVIIHDGLESIGNHAFNSSGISNIILPLTLKTIGYYSFSNCTKLISIDIPDSVSSIEQGAFNECSSLKSVKLPEKEGFILKDSTFLDCTSLEYVSIGVGTSSIGSNAFRGCTLENILIYAKAYKDNNESIAFETAKNLGCRFEDPDLGEYALIKYNLMGGIQNSENPVRYFKNQSASWELKDPSKEGFIFKCWVDDNENQITTLTNTIANSSSITAVWDSKKYTIKFNGNGSTSGSMSDMTIPCGDSINLSANVFKRTGYSFKGWNTKADGSEKYYADKASVKDLAKYGESITLYAQWTPVNYKINYVLNKGKNSSSNPSKYNINSSTITLKAAKKEGYKFAGWYSTSKFTKKVTEIKKGSTGDKTFYAKFTPITYKIKFDKNGGKGSMKTISTSYDKSVKLTKNTFKREGYTFIGWASKKTSKKAEYKNQAKVKNLSKTDGKTVTLYAVWKKNK